ncbi:BolA family protein [Tateyamaria sp. SN6-1]|uniref:BolA family protein n=1 Tax=Tateyamaria sp. SN6-1 TaxID=3092148 RepID=UPI0039F642FD
MSIRDEIEARLRAAFDVREIEVVDDSASHAGHAGAPAGGESHFNVMLRSADLAGQSRVARHRAVHKALGDIVPRIHALALDLDA